MQVIVTELAPDGGVRRAMVTTDGSSDAGDWEDLIARAALGFPPPYRPEPGRPVFHVHAGEASFLVGESNLVGPLRELVTAVLVSGVPTVAAEAL